jgi:hypothetical protein
MVGNLPELTDLRMWEEIGATNAHLIHLLRKRTEMEGELSRQGVSAPELEVAA